MLLHRVGGASAQPRFLAKGRTNTNSCLRAVQRSRCALHGVRALARQQDNSTNELCLNEQQGTPRGQAVPSSSTWQYVQQQLPKAVCIAAAAAVVSLVVPQVAHAASSAAAGEGSLLSNAISFILHLDKHMSSMIQQHGTLTYAILWTIVFCETGLVLTPFLPGDSLLFAAGAFAGMGQLSISLLFGVFITSAVLGDAVNYAIGNKLGRWALDKKLLEQKYIKQTEAFYDKYGGKTVVLARFVPIVRTFAPFVAGIGSMAYSK